MITAKTAKEGTMVEKYIKEKCREIEETIKISMDVGLCYAKYAGLMPKSIMEMLKELGYTVEVIENPFLGSTYYLISWANIPEKGDIKCN